MTSTAFASFFWHVLSAILPETTEKQANSAQLFQTSLSVLRSVGESAKGALDLDAYIRDWGKLLMDHEHHEVGLRVTLDFSRWLTI